MLNSSDLLANLYNAFNPFEPLPAGDPKYVDCQDVRGDADIEQELGNRMRLANTNTCQVIGMMIYPQNQKKLIKTYFAH